MIDIESLNKAVILTKKQCFEEAEVLYRQLLEKEPDNFFVLSAYGLSEFENGDFIKAASLLEKAANLKENHDVYHKLVQSLTKTGKLLEAEKYCVNYLRKHPDARALWLQLGFLKELIYSDDKQACECFKEAATLGSPQADYNIAVSYQKQGDFVNAEKYYKKILDRDPEDIDAITSLGMCCLEQKKFKEGYDLFFRRDKSSLDQKTNNPIKPGDKFESEIVVLCDQGFGDHIHFIRYLPFLQEKVKKIYVASHRALSGLFQKNYPDIEFISYDEIDPEMQSVRITDLAYILNIDFDNIPYPEGYLKSETTEIKSDKLKVGLCWEAGGAGIRTMINRTINIKLLEPFLNLENVQIYSFQVRDTLNGNERYPQMINLAKDFKNFEDTAKAMKAMDLIISVDTSVAHLAGALGVKTFLMLPYVTDWRWFRDTKTTPWYKSIEIFKQTDPISWEKPIEEIVCRLKEYSL